MFASANLSNGAPGRRLEFITTCSWSSHTNPLLMLLAYAATARQHRRAAAVTAVILVVGPLKNVCPLVALVGAAVNREFRFANRPRFSFSFIKGNSQEHLQIGFLIIRESVLRCPRDFMKASRSGGQTQMPKCSLF